MAQLAINVDTNLPKLAAALGELSEATRTSIMNQSLRDGIRAGAEQARKTINERGNYAKAGKAGAVRRGVTWRYHGGGQGHIQSVGQWWSLRPYVVGKRGKKMDYTSRKGAPGVRTAGHFGSRNWTSGRAAFVRDLNGNIHVASGRGSGWHPDGRRWRKGDKTNAKIDTVFRMLNPAHVLHHHETYNAVTRRSHSVIEARYASKYDLSVAKLKGKYGL